MKAARERVTVALEAADRGEPEGLDAILPDVYVELRRLAAGFLRREKAGHTLQPTALAHEAYLRLADSSRVPWKGRAHFLALAARSMRRVLVDHARRRAALKRGGSAGRVTLSDACAALGGAEVDVLALHEAIDALARLDPRKARVVELRFFAGMTSREAAAALQVSESTVEDDWAFARAWLRRRLR